LNAHQDGGLALDALVTVVLCHCLAPAPLQNVVRPTRPRLSGPAAHGRLLDYTSLDESDLDLVRSI